MNLLAGRVAPEHPISITVLPSSAPGWGAAGLCMRGWQVGEMLGSRRRLRHPLAWEEGEQRRVSWDEALERVRAKLEELRRTEPASIGIILGDSLSTEEVFAARLLADALGTSNIAALGLELDAPIIHGLELALGEVYRAPEVEELDDADLFICVNSNLHHVSPRAAGTMSRRLQQGARMVLIDEIDQGMEVWSEVHARHRPGLRAPALAHVVEALSEGRVTDGPLDNDDVAAILRLVDESDRVAIVFSAEAVASTDEASAIGELARVLDDGTRSALTYLVPSGANTFGTIDMLAPEERGSGAMGAMEMMSAGSGMRCLITIGEDLGRLFGPADLAALRQRLEMAVSLSSFVSPTATLADVTLPVSMAGEREGSIRRPCGHVWWNQRLIEPVGEAQSIIAVLEMLVDGDADNLRWTDEEALWEQIRARVSGYAQIELDALRAGELPRVGTDTPRVSDVVSDLVLIAPPIEPPTTDDEHPWLLLPRSTSGGWTTDPRCQGAHLLRREATLYRDPYALLPPEEMRELNVREGENVRLVTNCGAATVRVRYDDGLPPKTGILPTEFPGLLRTLAGFADTEPAAYGQPVSPIAGDVRPAETH